MLITHKLDLQGRKEKKRKNGQPNLPFAGMRTRQVIIDGLWARLSPSSRAVLEILSVTKEVRGSADCERVIIRLPQVLTGGTA